MKLENGSGSNNGVKKFFLNWKKRAKPKPSAKLWMQKSNSLFLKFSGNCLILNCSVNSSMYPR